MLTVRTLPHWPEVENNLWSISDVWEFLKDEWSINSDVCELLKNKSDVVDVLKSCEFLIFMYS